MSYIPDYRQDADKLTQTDRSYWLGYTHAMEDARNNLDNAAEDIPGCVEIMEEFGTLCECSEIETMCSIVEGNEAYEDIEFHDCNEPLYQNARGASE